MNRYVKEYLHRGLIFGGFGPIIAGIVILILDKTGTYTSVSGSDMFLAIVSTYICAFVHAGSSVFPSIEHWSKIKAMFWQFTSIYVVYLSVYQINGWMPLKASVIAIFTVCFLGGFLIIWAIVLASVNAATKRMNEKLESSR